MALSATVTAASAFQPHTGHWFDATQPGTGFNLDIQNGVLVLTYYSYQPAGPAQWYLSAGPMGNGQRSYVGPLDKYVNGQCPTCAYKAPVSAGSEGTISINFVNETTASVTLPGGRATIIHPYDFGYGNPPQGLLGEWIFVYDIIPGATTFAERFDFSTLIPGTSTGNGIAADAVRFAGCELQVSGALAGTVICADSNSSGTLENGYSFTYGGVDETFNGTWISPSSGNQYPMKGFRVVSPAGYSKAGHKSGDDPNTASKLAQDQGEAIEKASPELLGKLRAISERLAR